jgi:hypothetical protein
LILINPYISNAFWLTVMFISWFLAISAISCGSVLTSSALTNPLQWPPLRCFSMLERNLNMILHDGHSTDGTSWTFMWFVSDFLLLKIWLHSWHVWISPLKWMKLWILNSSFISKPQGHSEHLKWDWLNFLSLWIILSCASLKDVFANNRLQSVIKNILKSMNYCFQSEDLHAHGIVDSSWCFAAMWFVRSRLWLNIRPHHSHWCVTKWVRRCLRIDWFVVYSLLLMMRLVNEILTFQNSIYQTSHFTRKNFLCCRMWSLSVFFEKKCLPSWSQMNLVGLSCDLRCFFMFIVLKDLLQISQIENDVRLIRSTMVLFVLFITLTL